jgi:hypothetical protein
VIFILQRSEELRHYNLVENLTTSNHGLEAVSSNASPGRRVHFFLPAFFVISLFCFFFQFSLQVHICNLLPGGRENERNKLTFMNHFLQGRFLQLKEALMGRGKTT